MFRPFRGGYNGRLGIIAASSNLDSSIWNMQLLEIPVAIPDRIRHLLRPVVQCVDMGGSSGSSSGWDRMESLLDRWEQHTEGLEDDGLQPPDRETIPLIREVLHALRAYPVDPPLRLVPNREAGAVFEWRTGSHLWSIEVERDGALELSVFRSGRLVCQYRIA